MTSTVAGSTWIQSSNRQSLAVGCPCGAGNAHFSLCFLVAFMAVACYPRMSGGKFLDEYFNTRSAANHSLDHHLTRPPCTCTDQRHRHRKPHSQRSLQVLCSAYIPIRLIQRLRVRAGEQLIFVPYSIPES